MNSTLLYPEGYCHDCGEHILETDFFGRNNRRELLCTFCFIGLYPSMSLDYVAHKKLIDKLMAEYAREREERHRECVESGDKEYFDKAFAEFEKTIPQD